MNIAAFILYVVNIALLALGYGWIRTKNVTIRNLQKVALKHDEKIRLLDSKAKSANENLNLIYKCLGEFEAEELEELGPDELHVKLLRPDAHIPTRGTDGSAGLDIYVVEDVTMRPEDITMFHTGLAVEIPQGYTGLLCTRSSMGKDGIRLSSGMNIIDSDFRGEMKVYLRNDGIYERTINAGDRIAQLVIVPYLQMEVEVVEELSDTMRGAGGFGSTGK